MASMAELFAEDSSDEESVGRDKNEKEKSGGSDDAMDTSPVEEEEEEKGNQQEEEKASEAEAPKRQIQDDDDDSDAKADGDDDEGDAEFDDAEAGIVGRSDPRVERAREEMDAAVSSDGASNKTLSETSKPTFMHVLETKKPPEGVSLHMTKLPGMLVGIQPEAFDQETYSASMEEEEYSNVLHMIRWRYKRDSDGELERDDNDKLVRESNTRIVQWDDGSYTLHVGSEVFEVDSLKTKTPAGFAGINGYLYQSQKASYSTTGEESKEERTPGGTVLECAGPITSRLTARPSSLQSEAHRSLTIAVRQRNMKKARIAEYVTEQDPEKLKAERIKIKEEMEKDNARKNRARGGRRSTPGMTRRYLEEDEDDGRYDSVNIGALKRRGRDEEAFDYGDDSDDDLDEEDEWATQKLSDRKRKRQQINKAEEEDDDDEDIVLGDDSDSDDDEVIINRSKVGSASKKRSNQAVLEDEDDD